MSMSLNITKITELIRDMKKNPKHIVGGDGLNGLALKCWGRDNLTIQPFISLKVFWVAMG